MSLNTLWQYKIALYYLLLCLIYKVLFFIGDLTISPAPVTYFSLWWQILVNLTVDSVLKSDVRKSQR